MEERRADFRMPLKKAALTPPPGDWNSDKFFTPYFWFQRWEVFEGVFTPGTRDIADLFAQFKMPQSLAGLRILDVGSWNGCVAFECERRGAQEVLAIGPEDPASTGFRALQQLLRSRVRYQLGSAYSLDPGRIGKFDLIFFCGVLSHLRYPLLAIDNLRRVSRGEVLVHSVLQKPSRTPPGKSDRLALYLNSVPCWRFLRKSELQQDFSNWFLPNEKAVLEAFHSAGFDIRRVKEGKFRARVKPGLPEFLENPSCESRYYEALVSSLYHGDSLSHFSQKWVDRLLEQAEEHSPAAFSFYVRQVHRLWRNRRNHSLKRRDFQFEV